MCIIFNDCNSLTFQNKQGMENEKMDYLAMRLQTFETENERLKGDVVRLKNENDRLRMVCTLKSKDWLVEKFYFINFFYCQA